MTEQTEPTGAAYTPDWQRIVNRISADLEDEREAHRAWRHKAEAARADIARYEDAQGDINRLTTERDGAYRERAQLLAWLAALHAPHAVLAPAADIEDEDGWWLLFLTVAGRQLSWHIAPRDAELFNHVQRVDVTDPRAQWDGHTTAEKYERIRTLPLGQMRAAVAEPKKS